MMNDEQFVKAFQDNYQRVFNYIGGGGGVEQHFYMSLASKYTLANKQYSGVQLQKIVDQLQKEGLFRLESTVVYKLAAQLFHETNITNTILRLNVNDQLLNDVKFRKSSFRTIGALFLKDDEHAKRAKQLFNAMNRNQRILTSKEDIPYVVYLTANKEAEIKIQSETIYQYYNGLKAMGFLRGNHLQALAQIMTIYDAEFNGTFMYYVVQLKEELIKRSIKVKKIHYPYLGLLALTATNETKVNEIVTIHNLLMELKIFKHATVCISNSNTKSCPRFNGYARND